MQTLELLRKEIKNELRIDVCDSTRKREFVYARSLYFKLARELTKYSLDYIGNTVNKDHSTVLHGIKLFDETICKYEHNLMVLYYDIMEKYSEVEFNEYDDPIGYWKLRCSELEDKYHDVVDQYNKLVHTSLFLRGVMKKRGYKHKILDSPIKRFEKV